MASSLHTKTGKYRHNTWQFITVLYMNKMNKGNVEFLSALTLCACVRACVRACVWVGACVRACMRVKLMNWEHTLPFQTFSDMSAHSQWERLHMCRQHLSRLLWTLRSMAPGISTTLDSAPATYHTVYLVVSYQKFSFQRPSWHRVSSEKHVVKYQGKLLK